MYVYIYLYVYIYKNKYKFRVLVLLYFKCILYNIAPYPYLSLLYPFSFCLPVIAI